MSEFLELRDPCPTPTAIKILCVVIIVNRINNKYIFVGPTLYELIAAPPSERGGKIEETIAELLITDRFKSGADGTTANLRILINKMAKYLIFFSLNLVMIQPSAHIK